MTALVKSGGNALTEFGGVNPWAEAGKGSETGAYLKFNGNSGDLTYGSDDTPLANGSLLVPDMTLYSKGWTCWKDSDPVEEILIPILEGNPPHETALPDHGPFDDADDGWRESGSLPFVILEHGTGDDALTHDDVGASLLFKTSTGGAVKSLKKLSAAYGRLFMTRPGLLPIVEIVIESYEPKVKKHGTKWAISFKIVDWITESELGGIAQGAPGDDEDDYEPEPAPKVAAKELPAPEPAPVYEDEEPAPAPVARRRSAPVEPIEEEVAPAPVRRRAAPVEPVVEAEPDVAPAPRRRAAPAAAVAPEDEDGADIAPVARGRSPGRGEPPANARIRRFAPAA